jgi:hypothetical protein
MEKIKIEREALVLDADERNKLRECLRYCSHRLNFHPECGIHNVIKPEFVDYMIKNLE